MVSFCGCGGCGGDDGREVALMVCSCLCGRERGSGYVEGRVATVAGRRAFDGSALGDV